MHLINAKQVFSPIVFLVFYLSIGTCSAEWIRAKVTNANNDIWVNTETNALYVGDSCKPLMQLKHLGGTKPRSLQQRQQAYLIQSENNYNSNNAGQNSSSSTTNNRVKKQNKKKIDAPLDPLNLSYQTQPTFDPLHRNNFIISIDNNNIVLSSQHAQIKAIVRGRYDRRAECGL